MKQQEFERCLMRFIQAGSAIAALPLDQMLSHVEEDEATDPAASAEIRAAWECAARSLAAGLHLKNTILAEGAR